MGCVAGIKFCAKGVRCEYSLTESKRVPIKKSDFMRTFLTVFIGGIVGVVCVILLRMAGLGPDFDQLLWKELGKNQLSTIISSEGSLGMAVVLSFVLSWVAVDVPRSSQRWLLGLLTVLLLGTGSLVLALYNVMFSPVLPIIGAFSGFLASATLTRIGPGAFRRRVDEVFANSLSRKQMRTLYNGSASALKTAHQVKAAVLVLEMKGHSALVGQMSAQDLADMSRVYLSMTSDFLCEAGGFLESCSGYQVRAVFGVPTGCESPAQVATRVALELSHRLGRLNLESDSRWHHMLDFQIGIASGELIAGVFGAPRGLPFTVVGDTIEKAVSLARANEIYGSHILICMETHRQAGELVEVRPMELVYDGLGNSEIYELICLQGALSPERKRSRDCFWSGVNHARASRWDEAIEEFAKSRIKGIPDAPIDYFLRKIERERNPPLFGHRDLRAL